MDAEGDDRWDAIWNGDGALGALWVQVVAGNATFGCREENNRKGATWKG